MATRIVEGKKPYTGGKAIEIDENKVISLRLRDENNLIIWDEGDNEIYVDLQLPADIEPIDAFPVGITTGRVSTVDGWDKTGTIICAKTTNGDNIKLLYADDGTLYIDNGTGTFKQIYLKGDIDAIVQAIYQYIDANFNTKTFFINNNEEEMSVIQDAYTWVANGGEAILCYRYGGLGKLYISETINNTGMLTFKGTINCDKYIQDDGYTKLMFSNLRVYATNGVVTGITVYRNNLLNAIEANTTYETPYIPQFPSQPTSKKYVDDKVAELMALGKFLSLWSCKDGEPMSFPLTTPYMYTTGDYYLVGELATGSNPNLKPDGSSYDTGDVSQVTESAEVQIGDVYIYDGTVWMHQLNHERTTTFANIAGQPTDNQNLATALGNKQDTLVNQTNIKSVNNNSLLGDGNLILDTVPSGGTQGQVLTKQSVGYGWANATGGAEIEYKTQAEYDALPSSKLTDGKHYFIYTPSVVPAIPTANLVAYYPLVSDAEDHKSDLGVIGTTYNGTRYGTANYTTVGGKTSANFTRGSNRIDTGVTIGNTPLTLCAMTYCTYINDWCCVIGNPSYDQNDGYAIRAYNSASNPYLYIFNNGTSSDINLSSNTLVPNTWQCLVITIDNGETKFYIDGNLVFTTQSGGTASNYGGFYIASFGAKTEHGRTGNIRDVAIYNKILDASEVTQYYTVTL